MLAYRNSSFLQVLEGPQVILELLFAKICSDWRHRNIRLVSQQNCDQRKFVDWSMAYLGYEIDLCQEFQRTRMLLTASAADQVVNSLAAHLRNQH